MRHEHVREPVSEKRANPKWSGKMECLVLEQVSFGDKTGLFYNVASRFRATTCPVEGRYHRRLDWIRVDYLPR